jgi:transposase-like protein
MTSANKEIVAKVKCLECPIEKEFNKYDVNRGRQKNWKCRSCAMKSLWAKKGVRTKEEKAEA